jgi:uncharacterized protein YecE (DUF72 family)
MKWYIGCSGFHYANWKECFYPEKLPQKNWFEYYCTKYNTLELNVSFYRFPTAEMLRKWYDKSSPQFLFSIKAPRLITHYKKFNDCHSLMMDFYQAVDKGLADKTACVLFQLPASIKYSKELLELMCKSMSSSFHNVIEFRDPSWWTKEVKEKLENHKITFCSISHPDPLLPDSIEITNDTIYVRMHGKPKLYYSAYTKKYIEDLYKKISSSNIQQVFIYFNNTATDAAVRNSSYLQLLSGMAYSFNNLTEDIMKKKPEKNVKKIEPPPKKVSSVKKVKTTKKGKESYPPVDDLG